MDENVGASAVAHALVFAPSVPSRWRRLPPRPILHIMIQATQSTMKAIALDRFGGLETMKLQMLPVPEVGPNEVLIHVESAGMGQWDAFEREGGFAREFGIEPKFPYVLGSDGAGTVAAVGDRVKGLKPGDRVYAFRLAESQGRFLRRVRRGQGGRCLAHPRQADDPAGGRDARGRDDRASRLG